MFEGDMTSDINSSNSEQINESAEFDRHWLRSETSAEPVYQDIKQIRDYARLAFDRLDLDKNGFIERSELFTFLQSDKVSSREKSFITFLLNNQEAIAEMVSEEKAGPESGISRDDLESYFALVINLIGA